MSTTLEHSIKCVSNIILLSYHISKYSIGDTWRGDFDYCSILNSDFGYIVPSIQLNS